MGGAIAITSTPGQGTIVPATVRLDLPLTAASEPQRVDLTGVRVLIVDDHLTSCTLFAHVAQAWGMQLTYTCARNAFTVGTIIPRLVFALT
mgnify:CR=1 FL=1